MKRTRERLRGVRPEPQEIVRGPSRLVHGVSRLRRPPEAGGAHGQVACGILARRKVEWTRDRAKVTCKACEAELEDEDRKLALREGTGVAAPKPAPSAAEPDLDTFRAQVAASLEGLSRAELTAVRDTVRMFKARRGVR